MNPSRYKEIRVRPDFLFMYFKECTGNRSVNSPQEFDMFLQVWLLQFIGVNPLQGVDTIIQFLDKKFGL
jgi:hypothetical protein